MLIQQVLVRGRVVSSVAPATGSDSDLVGGGQPFRGRDVLLVTREDDTSLLRQAVHFTECPFREAKPCSRSTEGPE